MNNVTIYDYAISSSSSIPWEGLLILVFLVVLIISIIIGWKHTDLKTKIAQVLVSVVLIIAGVGVSVSSFDNLRLKHMYSNGQYEITEGAISQYITHSNLFPDERQPLYDEFYVNGICFTISESAPFGIGYTQRKANDGELDENMYVRIQYIEYKYMNVIFKIEVLNN